MRGEGASPWSVKVSTVGMQGSILLGPLGDRDTHTTLDLAIILLTATTCDQPAQVPSML